MFLNSNVFGSFIIHILYTGCAKIKKNNSGTKRLTNFVCHVTSGGSFTYSVSSKSVDLFMGCVGKSIKVLSKLGFVMNKSNFYVVFRQIIV